MVLEISTLPRKLGVLATAGLASAALAFPLSVHFRVDQLNRRGTQQHLEEALRLRPGDAELHNRLGRTLLYSPLQSAERALRELEQATRLDGRNGQYWMDLALAHELRGDTGAAATAVARARAAEPRTPAILWQEANFLVRREKPREALEALKILLAASPEYTVKALAFFGRVANPGVLVERAVPVRKDALEAAIEFVSREGAVSAAPQLWNAVARLPEGPSEYHLRRLLDWLIQERQVELATHVWNESSRRGWLNVDVLEAGKPVYNASFEKPVQSFGFDWRVLPHPGTSAWIEARGPSPGLFSLCIQFSDESRSDYAHAVHSVPVDPRSIYILKAALRSERLLSRVGVSLMLQPTEAGRPAVLTDTVAGTSHWREMISRIETGSEEKLVHIRLVRPAPGKDEEHVSGLVCLADVRWQKLGEMERVVSTVR